MQEVSHDLTAVGAHGRDDERCGQLRTVVAASPCLVDAIEVT